MVEAYLVMFAARGSACSYTCDRTNTSVDVSACESLVRQLSFVMMAPIAREPVVVKVGWNLSEVAHQR